MKAPAMIARAFLRLKTGKKCLGKMKIKCIPLILCTECVIYKY